MASCDHIQHHDLDDCPGLTPEEVEFGDKVRSISLNFVQCGGKADFHGDFGTVRERQQEMRDNAKRYGNEEPIPTLNRWV